MLQWPIFFNSSIDKLYAYEYYIHVHVLMRDYYFVFGCSVIVGQL